MPVVSVIIPAYNASKHIAEAIRSVELQQGVDYELIVVDDGSTDCTADVVRSFKSARYVYQDNAGVSAARNAGAKLATGEYIAFLDSDDCWHPEKLKLQLAALRKNPESYLCRTGCVEAPSIADSPNVGELLAHIVDNKALPRVINDWATSLLNPYFVTSSVMVPRDVFGRVGGFDEKLKIAEDIDFYLRVLSLSPRVIFLPQVLVFKREVKGSLGDNSTDGYRQLINVYESFFKKCSGVTDKIDKSVRDRAFRSLQVRLAQSMLREKDTQGCRRALLDAASYGWGSDLLIVWIKTLLANPVGHILRSVFRPLFAGRRTFKALS